MQNLTNTAIRLYRHLFGTPDITGLLEDGLELLLDGNSAVAITEAMISDSASFGGSFPANGSVAAWLSEQQRQPARSSLATEGPRGALAAAMGLAMAGRRATTFLSGPDLAANGDLLTSAVGRRLPLVIHLANRALDAQGSAFGTGHEALHLAADSGAVILIAASIQEAVDLTLIARRVAELTLLPVIVAIDGDETALAIEGLRLPTPTLIGHFIGDRRDEIDAPDTAQRMLFGDRRPRLPRWHDLDQPALHGALYGRESYALGRAAQTPFFAATTEAHLEQAFIEFQRLSGRRYDPLSQRLPHCDHLLLVEGSAVESVASACETIRKRHKIQVGVVGIRALRPWPAGQLTALLEGKRSITVLERCDSPLAAELPLEREVSATLQQSGLTALPLRSVVYGMGGLPLQGCDLLALCEQLDTLALPRRRFLGLDFHRRETDNPKRQVMLDTLRRHYPDAAPLGITGSTPLRLNEDSETLSLALHQLNGIGHGAGTLETAGLLHTLLGGHLHAQRLGDGGSWGGARHDLIAHHPKRQPMLLADQRVRVTLTTSLQAAVMRRINPAPNGALLLCPTESLTPQQLWARLPAGLQQQVERHSLTLYTLPHDEGLQPALQQEAHLGALFGVLLAEGQLEIKARRVVAARDAQLAHLKDAQRTAQIAAFRQGLAGITPLPQQTRIASTPALAEPVAPQSARRLGDNGQRHDSLPRFWDQVGVLYQQGSEAHLTADPYMATGTLPPLTATFRSTAPLITHLPEFNPLACNGCGKCWSYCPDSAIGSAAVTPKALLDAAITLSGASAVRQISGKLSTRLAALGHHPEQDATTLGALLDDALVALEQTAPLPAERRGAVVDGLGQIKQALGALRLAYTETLFTVPEQQTKASGTLLALAINPDSCKGCGLCHSLCESGALPMVTATPETIGAARQQWEYWQQSPDSHSATIEQLASGTLGPMAAIMLSRHCAFALSGGDSAEPGSGEKIALRQLLAATEYQQQPLLHRFTAEVGIQRDAILVAIRSTLADALPTDDLDGLAATLADAGSREVSLTALTQGTLDSAGVDVVHLRQLIALAKRLERLQWQLSQGQHGLGRARFGITLAAGTTLTWAAAFPDNPFQVPVSVDSSGESGQLAAGLMQGQLDETLAALQLLEDARHALGGTGRKEKRAPLRWETLSEEQRRLCPPLFLIGSSEALAGQGMAQLSWLLAGSLPIKMVVLADYDLGLADSGRIADTPLAARADACSQLPMAALAQRSGYVAQCSIAYPDQLRSALREALRFTGPALLHLHAPSPARHGFAVAAVVEQARLAVVSRLHPLFRYNPLVEGVFGLRLNISDNPAEGDRWVSDGSGHPVTPANWAQGEQRFAPRLKPLSANAPSPTPLDSWLALAANDRSAKSPYLTITSGGATQRIQLDPALAQMVGERSHAWRTLQELAGVVTPFTERVKAAAVTELQAAHQGALDALRGEYEAKLEALRTGMENDYHARVKGQLMELAGYVSHDDQS